MSRDPVKRAQHDRRYWKTPRGQYCRHKANAKRRGVPFKLTFVEWMTIWMESGKWPQRGNKKGQYCMGRRNDMGAYEMGNVAIVLHEQNTRTRNKSVAGIPDEDPWP